MARGRRRGRRTGPSGLAGGRLVGAGVRALWPGGGGAGRARLVGWPDVVARVGVEAGGLAGGRLVGAGRALGLGGLAGGADVVARVGVEAGGLAGGRLVGAGRALVWADWRWSRRSGPRRRRGRWTGRWRAGRCRPRTRSGRTGRWWRRSGPRRRRGRRRLSRWGW